MDGISFDPSPCQRTATHPLVNGQRSVSICYDSEKIRGVMVREEAAHSWSRWMVRVHQDPGARTLNSVQSSILPDRSAFVHCINHNR
eukprot:scaffold19_cov114-Cylindrotheca_fusiformis.AAC.11